MFTIIEVNLCCFRKLNGQVVRAVGWEPPTPPKVDLSLLRYRQEFQKNETYKPPKVYDLKKGKDILQSGDFKGRHEGVFYSGGCVIRTTKKGVENSKRMREEESGNYGRGSGRALNPRWTESRREKGHKEYSRGRQAESPARKRRRSRSRSRGSTRRADKYKDRNQRSETTTAKRRSASRSRSRRADKDMDRQHKSETTTAKRRSASRPRSRKADMDKDRQHRREHDDEKRERRRSRSRSSGRRC